MAEEPAAVGPAGPPEAPEELPLAALLGLGGPPTHAALRGPAARALLAPGADHGPPVPGAWVAAARARAAAKLAGPGGAAEVLGVAVAALQAAAAANLTGPDDLGAADGTGNGAAEDGDGGLAGLPAAPAAVAGAAVATAEEEQRWAEGELRAAADGEDTLGRAGVRRAPYLVLAVALLAECRAAGACGGGERFLATLWAARAALLQQRLRAAPAASLHAAASRLYDEAAALALPDASDVDEEEEDALRGEVSDADDGAEKAAGSPPRPRRQQPPPVTPLGRAAGAVVLLERALLHHEYRRGREAARCLRLAGRLLGLTVGKTGALGTRTVHQVDPKAQLVLQATPAADAGGVGPDGAAGWGGGREWLRQDLGAVTDVLEAPALLEAGAGPPPLGPLEQALVLGWLENEKKAKARDELQGTELRAYWEALARQPPELVGPVPAAACALQVGVRGAPADRTRRGTDAANPPPRRRGTRRRGRGRGSGGWRGWRGWWSACGCPGAWRTTGASRSRSLCCSRPCPACSRSSARRRWRWGSWAPPWPPSNGSSSGTTSSCATGCL